MAKLNYYKRGRIMTDIEKAELKAKLQMIYEHYGKYQFKKCVEELQELIEAIELYIASDYDYTNHNDVKSRKRS